MKDIMAIAALVTQKGDDFISRHGPVEFHKLAHELLDEANIHECFDMAEFIKISLRNDFKIKQNYASAQFSDYPLTIASGEHCFLDIYFWRRRPTVIHNHHFTGAFQCLKGINVDFEFEYINAKKLGLYHDLGELKLKKSRKILKVDIAPIDLLDKFIHQNHHQDELTINVCLRTPDIGATNLSNYLYSGLRFEKHPELLGRTHRLWNFLFLGELNPDELDLSIDDALSFLIQYQRSTSLSKNFVNLRSFMERRVKDELGVDVAVHLAQHEARMNELENLYD